MAGGLIGNSVSEEEVGVYKGYGDFGRKAMIL